ncbi:class II fructose-bisphosphate aldolase [Enterococcus xiangfangensis]|uniref:Class II fructose-bisphosphate aldolase n=1 Tax=Enterococcus xiangfangensis TaxID=1296537 RepID=A0ABU3FB93_9ENTE|nr:class II fructose-bisphosphate aldolase [Enterococcus xiangfangensis]MBM7712416.1 ketose-bisphosphate aldolase [Enterococcus xiangfangensis]MDT2759929.1 class II fructose-bisphosphate aldolase [Enterococcus xiangfangensis]NBK08907.1 class II fructose-bisphosphate aldolase [Enterococcus asini]
MLVTSKELFKVSREKGFAIPAPNFIDAQSMKDYVAVAEELNLPVILALAEVHLEFISLEEAAYFGKFYAENAKVPVVLHLDHGMTPSIIKKAIDVGFTSVMIDASQDSFETNVKKTKEIIDYAHPKGVVVEAEIGHVGSGVNYENHEETDSRYTTVEDAIQFVKETQVDSLAVSIGTAHGMYKGVPEINFDRLHEIAEAVDTPLVLHGGSSSGDSNLNRCGLEGISKINIFSDLVNAAQNGINSEKPENYLDLKHVVSTNMKNCLRHYYEVFCTNRINE